MNTETNNERNDQFEISYRNLMKRTLVSNLLRMISRRIADGPSLSDLSSVEFLQLLNYFHYLGKSSNDYPSLPTDFTDGYANDILDKIKTYGSSISSSTDPFLSGINSLRDFISEQFPNVSKVLAHLAPENAIYYTHGENCTKSDGSLSPTGQLIISILFRGNYENRNGRYCDPNLRNVTQILPLNILPNDPNCESDLSDDMKQLSTALRAISDMYYNIDIII